MTEPMQSRYRILARLGAGGMGVVYRAEDVALKRPVALKFLHEEASGREHVRARFLREARAAAALSHPGICTIYEVGEVDPEGGRLIGASDQIFPPGTPFIAMEFVEGRTLRAVMGGRPMPAEEAVRVATEIADGLAKAHQARIVHRDLKPENVMITPEGRVKILDFGLAKTAEDGSAVRRAATDPQADTVSIQTTLQGEVIGSAAYLSPEQARGQAVDVRSDVFSFGILLYEMVTGRRPFHGPSRMDTISAIMRDPAAPARELNPTVPLGLERIVFTCLEKDRERRYPSAVELRDDLGRLAAGLPVAARAVPATRRRLRLAAAAAAVVLVVAAGAAVLSLRGRPAARPAPGSIRSVVVLPLANLSGDPDQEYLADGITEVLIADLAQIGALRVISRTSAMRYKGAGKPVPEIARELGVDGVVEGSVLRSGGKVRVTAQLIHAATDAHLWARTYERDAGDVLDLQSEVARAIAEEIQVAVTPRERARLAAARRADPAVHDAYLRGRYYWNRRTEEGLRRGLDHFQRAIDQDPAYAPAWAGLADSYNLLAFYSYLPADEGYSKAIAAATKALEIDEGLAEAHASLGYARYYAHWDRSGAEREFRRAVDLQPGYATVHHWYALLLANEGRLDEARAEITKAVEQDPLSLIINAAVGWILYFARDDDAAIAQFKRTLELDAGFGPAHWVLGQVFATRGKYSEAASEFEALEGGSPLSPAALRRLAAGDREGALRTLEDEGRAIVGVNESAYYMASNYALLGEKDPTFEWLDRAFEEREIGLLNLKVEPMFDPVRGDPRFAAALGRLGLPP